MNTSDHFHYRYQPTKVSDDMLHSSVTQSTSSCRQVSYTSVFNAENTLFCWNIFLFPPIFTYSLIVTLKLLKFEKKKKTEHIYYIFNRICPSCLGQVFHHNMNHMKCCDLEDKTLRWKVWYEYHQQLSHIKGKNVWLPRETTALKGFEISRYWQLKVN